MQDFKAAHPQIEAVRSWALVEEPPPAAAPAPAIVSAAELRAQAQAVVNLKLEEWAAIDRGYGVRLGKVGTKPIYDESGMHRRLVRHEDIMGEVAIKSPKEREYDKRKKSEDFFEKKRMKAVRSEYDRRAAKIPAAHAPAPAAGAADAAVLRAALLPTEAARGHAARVERMNHTERAQLQHTRVSEGAPLSSEVELARRERQYQESRPMPPVSGEVKTGEAADWHANASWIRTVSWLQHPRESKWYPG